MRAGQPPEQARGPVETHLHHVENRRREIPVDAGPLRDIGDLVPRALDRLAEHVDLARQARHDPEAGLEHRGFAGAVRVR
jgi:hypothetical protein